VFATMACHGALRAGDVVTREAALTLLGQLDAVVCIPTVRTAPPGAPAHVHREESNNAGTHVAWSSPS